MLYDPVRHHKFEIQDFSSDKLNSAIQEIIESTLKVDSATSFWPVHPKDHFDECPLFLTDFYMGAAGVVWALDQLNLHNKIEIKNYCKNKIDLILDAHLKLGETSCYSDKGAFFVGEAGVRAVKEKLNPTPENQIKLKALIESKLDSTENELLYGLPGSLLIAHFSSHPESKKLSERIIDRLFSTREIDPISNAKIWSQTFEKTMYYFGAAHGTIGNYGILLNILSDNEKEKRSDVIANLEKFLQTYAKIENKNCNWPKTLPVKDDSNFLVHWCHGATGIVTALATNIKNNESEIISDLIIKAGNLIWEAGPLEKGTSLCHGSAGSGMAMLKIYERTNDPIWLERAQAFAMHSINQHKAEVKEAGQLRYSLWTGDLGLALFLRDTLKTSSSMPGIDIF